MDRHIIITKRAGTEREERNADGQTPAPLLDSPLPTPRRSCVSVDASSRHPRCRRESSPLRTHVPFSWESSPGVPKNNACGRDMHKKMPPPPRPRPPPGRPQPCLATNSYYYGGNTSEASTDDDEDDRSFSDALDRISSPERTGSSFDRVTSKRFEDIFLGRATSFAKERSSTDLSASGRHHPRQPPRRISTRRGHDDEDRRWTPRLLNDNNVPMQLMQRIRMDAEAEEMTPRACGLMVFFPWSAKPAVCGFRGGGAIAAHHAATTTRVEADYDAPSPRSRSSRITTTTTTTTLRDVIKEDNEAIGGGDLPQPRGGEKKRGREDLQQGRRWGVSSLLDTSKKYCTDARKALSKLSIGLGAADSGSPRVSAERRGGKLRDGFSSSTPATPAKLTKMKANSRN
ncbi:hypothetical protein HU200_004856 [Digitaria exilis]|uniref:Uncharacterized protein n=1 Tax=Digitaria exilis TaxID=1010633 RepID=A0A835FUJ1_9POAL|nr:hypothetical protein HU200_004856 [Digitaria exilis]